MCRYGRSIRGYLTIVGRAGVWPDSVQVPRWVALHPGCPPAVSVWLSTGLLPSGPRDEAWLKRGLPCSQ